MKYVKNLNDDKMKNYEKNIIKNGVKKEDENNCDSDIISNYIGHYGKWQFYWTFVLCLFQLPSTFQIFAFVFQVFKFIFFFAISSFNLFFPVFLQKNSFFPSGLLLSINL